MGTVQSERRSVCQVPCEDVKALIGQVNEMATSMATLSQIVSSHENDINNHGKDGLKTKFNEFVARYEERQRLEDLARKEKQRLDDEAHKELAERDLKNRDRFRFILTIVVSLGLLIVAFLTLNLQTHWITFNAQNSQPLLFVHLDSPQQHAGMR